MYESNATAAMQGAGYAKTYGGLTETPRDETSSRIRDSISQAEQILSELHETIGYLEKRLDTVLVPVPPSVASVTQNKPGPSGPPPSHVQGRVTILNEGYFGAVQRLRDLAQRLDV